MTMSDKSTVDGTKRKIEEFEGEDQMPPKKLYVDKEPLAVATLLAKLNENERRRFQLSNIVIEPFEVDDKENSDLPFVRHFQHNTGLDSDMAPLSFNPEEDDIDDDEYGHYEDPQQPLDPAQEKMVYEYFKSRFRAEAIRLILHYKEQKFKDVKLDMMTEWPKRKSTTPLGGLPVLTIDGVQLSQSLPICQFLARKYNLAGKDELEIAHVNAIADFQNDLMNATVPYIVGVLTESKDLEERKKTLKENVEKYWPKLVQLLRASKSAYFADSGLTWVDFFVAEYTDTAAKLFPSLGSKYPDLIQHSSRIHSIPQLQKYLDTRPETFV
ncbi:hypothetical protein FO519_002587 [Halicephalobus sp. NKZ332]|nr:hypothetical protein FO519_002587 [Halicephalobus sp. NKZ332]